MKAFTIVNIFLFCMTTNIFSQKRISDIQNIVPIQNTAKLTSIADTDYLIEQSDDGMTISKVVDDTIRLIKTLKHKSEIEDIVSINNTCEFNEAVLYKDTQYMEVFSKSIFLTHVMTGELMKKIELTSDSLLFDQYIGLEDGKFLILKALSKSYGSYFTIVNLETGTITVNPNKISPKEHRIGVQIFTFVGNQLNCYDMLTKDIKTVMTTDSPIYQIKSFIVDCELRLGVLTSNGTVYIRDKEKITNVIDCFKEKKLVNDLYVKGNIAMFYYEEGIKRAKIYDLNNCSLYELNNNLSIIPLHIKELPDDKIIFYVSGFNIKYQILLDVNNFKFHTIKYDQNIDKLSTSSSFVKNNKLYIAGEYIYNLALVYTSFIEIDLTTALGKRVGIVNEIGNKNILFSSFKNNKLNIFKYKTDYTATLYSYSESTTELVLLSLIHKTKNLGITNLKNVYFDQKSIFSYTTNGLYKSSITSDIKLLDYKSTNFLKKYNDHIFAIGNVVGSELGYQKINIHSNQSTYQKLEDNIPNNLHFYDTQCLMIKEVWGEPNQRYSFDYITGKYTKGINLPTLKIIHSAISDKNVLLGQYVDQNSLKFSFYESCQNGINATQFQSKGFDVFSVGDGSFYYASAATTKREIFRFNRDLTIDKTIDIPSCTSFTVPEIRNIGLDTATSVLPFKRANDLIFVFDNKNTVTYVTIPFINAGNYNNILWRKNADKILVAIPHGNLIAAKAGEVPRIIAELYKGYNVEDAIIDGDDFIILCVNQYNSMAKIVHYSYLEDKIMDILDLPYLYTTIALEKNALKLNNNEYLFVFSGQETGKELWIYKKSTHTFKVLKDIKAGKGSSDPQHLVRVDKNIYFTAKDNDGSRQWFEYEPSTGSVENDIDFTFKISPTPTSDFVFIQSNVAKEFKMVVRSIDGLFMDGFNFKTEKQLDVSRYFPGVYVIEVVGNKKFNRIKFVKI